MKLFRKKRLIRSSVSPWDMKRRRGILLRFQQFFQGKGPFILAGVLIGGVSIYEVFFTSLFFVRSIEVYTDHKDINPKKLEIMLHENAFQKNILFLSLETIATITRDKFPEVKVLVCDRKIFSRTLVCEAEGYPLVAVMKHEGKKYYMNENGLVILFDSRKLGLPVFDLILNPIFAGIPVEKAPDENVSATPQRKVFEVVPGKKILSAEEVKTMLSTITEFEKVLERKVIQILYVQVAGELSLTTKGDLDHFLTVLMDIRRNLPEQFKKLEKSKKVIDLKSVERIDLSIDGEKVFYR